MTNKNCFNIAIIGAGKTAGEYLKVLSNFKCFNLNAIFSRSIEKAHKLKNEYPTLQVFQSIKEMYQKSDIDLVIVVVSHESIINIYLEILDYPWKVFFEKPIGINYLDFKKIANKVKKSKRSVHVAMNRRHYTSTNSLLKFIAKEKSKRIIEINDAEDTNYLIKNGKSRDIVNNWMYINSVHLIDYCTFLTRGKLVSLKNIVPWNRDKFVMSILKYSSGDIVIYKAYWNKPNPWSVKVTTNNSYFIKEPIEYLSYKNISNNKLIETRIPDIENSFKSGFYNQANEIKNYLRDKPHKLPDLDEYRKTVEIIKKIYET